MKRDIGENFLRQPYALAVQTWQRVSLQASLEIFTPEQSGSPCTRTKRILSAVNKLWRYGVY